MNLGMTLGTEDRKKLIAAICFGALAVVYLVYMLAGSSSNDDAPIAPVPVATVRTITPVARSSSRLDPALHPESMLLTESLLYTGTGRNIFRAVGAPPPAVVNIPQPIAPPRFLPPVQANLGPPPPPPIDLRFFGTSTRRDGKRQAFLLQGEDVFIASTGDIIARRYRIGDITLQTVEVTDLTNNNRQRLPVTTQ